MTLIALDIFSTAMQKFKMTDSIQAGYIEKNRDVFVKKLAHTSTGYYTIDNLDIKTKEIVADQILTQLRKKVKEASRSGDVLLQDVDKFLKEIQLDASKNLHKYRYVS